MKSELKILVCGDRNWTDAKMIKDVLRPFADLDLRSVTVISGGAKGADHMAHHVANQLHMVSHRFMAEWKKYGKAAGPIRNQRMLEQGRPDLVFAFHADISNSRGTKDLVNRARRMKIPTCVFPQWEVGVKKVSSTLKHNGGWKGTRTIAHVKGRKLLDGSSLPGRSVGIPNLRQRVL